MSAAIKTEKKRQCLYYYFLLLLLFFLLAYSLTVSASNKPLAKLYKVLNNQGQKLVPNHTITDLITG